MGDFFKNRIILLLLLLLLLIIFLFVFNTLRSGQTGDTTPPTSSIVYESGAQVELFCTNDCKGHGQCGELVDRQVVILTNRTAPATQNHTLNIPNSSIVTVRGRRNEQTVGVFDSARRDTTVFYQVDWGGLTTWVAGWCVAE